MIRSQARVCALLLAVVLSSGACSHLRTGPVPVALQLQVRERFYSISADDAEQLNRELTRQGRESTGRNAYALTRWRLSWSYTPTTEAGRCTAANPQVRIEIVTTLPRWVEASRVEGPLERDWSLFMDRLRLHESGHQDIALRGGSELLSRLRDLESSSCARLRSEAIRVARTLSTTSEADQLAFDRTTRYGLAVGDP